MSFKEKLQKSQSLGVITPSCAHILMGFYESFATAVEGNYKKEDVDTLFTTYLRLVEKQLQEPYTFLPYHAMVTEAFDYYSFGLEFIRPLIDMQGSTLTGVDNLAKVASQLASKDNVIFLANHQIEADPQAISVLLEKDFPSIGKQMIFVAGERVITDPLAVPFSMGRNLLCIFSKRYIDHPPELKNSKQLHNKKTMETMKQMLSEGGCCIYVAPSGGRDRKGHNGSIEVAPFDPQSIEMFYLMAKKSQRPTHFYPLALYTFDLLPPPETVQRELGEKRTARRTAIHASFGKEIAMEDIPCAAGDKHQQRLSRAAYIESLVVRDYKNFPIPKG